MGSSASCVRSRMFDSARGNYEIGVMQLRPPSPKAGAPHQNEAASRTTALSRAKAPSSINLRPKSREMTPPPRCPPSLVCKNLRRGTHTAACLVGGEGGAAETTCRNRGEDWSSETETVLLSILAAQDSCLLKRGSDGRPRRCNPPYSVACEEIRLGSKDRIGYGTCGHLCVQFALVCIPSCCCTTARWLRGCLK
jgi:hypothetical protein